MEKMHLELSGQMLHAKSIEFIHPVTKEKLKIEAPLPKYFKEVLDKLELISVEEKK